MKLTVGSLARYLMTKTAEEGALDIKQFANIRETIRQKSSEGVNIHLGPGMIFIVMEKDLSTEEARNKGSYVYRVCGSINTLDEEKDVQRIDATEAFIGIVATLPETIISEQQVKINNGATIDQIIDIPFSHGRKVRSLAVNKQRGSVLYFYEQENSEDDWDQFLTDLILQYQLEK